MEREKWFLEHTTIRERPIIIVSEHLIVDNAILGYLYPCSRSLIQKVSAWILGNVEWAKEFKHGIVEKKYEVKYQRKMWGLNYQLGGGVA